MNMLLDNVQRDSQCAGHAASRGGKSGLSDKPIFPKPRCLSQQQKFSEEPEAHTSGACLLPIHRSVW